MMKKFLSIFGSALVMSSISGQAMALNQYQELNMLNPLAIGPTYTSNLYTHAPGEFFTDSLAFNIPSSDLTAKVITFEVGNFFTFLNLTGKLFKGINPAFPASCLAGPVPSCSPGFQDLGIIGSGSNNWTSLPISLNAPGHYFINISGNAPPTALGGTYVGQITLSPIPEAPGWVMLLAGLSAVGAVARRRLPKAA